MHPAPGRPQSKRQRASRRKPAQGGGRMKNELALPALEGTNPLGYLAALGVLDALARKVDGARLRWTDELVPHAVIGGLDDLDLLLDVLDHDREEWRSSVLL